MTSKLAQQAEHSAWESKQFSGVFLPELVAVEARRRRYRIEQILGELPKPPAPLPTGDEPVICPCPPGTPPTLGQLQERKKEADRARKALEESRRMNLKVSCAEGSTAKDAASTFLAAALAWHQDAKTYCEAQMAEAAKTQAPDAVSSWEQAEAIFAAAANTLSTAVKEVRVERDGDATGAPKHLAASETALKEAFGQVLAWENKTSEDLKAYRDAVNQAAPAVQAKAAKAFCRTKYHLALAERRLFDEAAVYMKAIGDAERSESCSQAADAAKREEQRASRDWRRVQIDGTPKLGANRDDRLLDEARKIALDQNLVGLSLSGGGIRSGTFALGVLQGLAQLRLLGMVDYLSTVSGGGYIGSWFAAWVLREGGLKNVERQLSPNRVSQAHAPRTGLPLDLSVDAEPEPVHHLRAYSRYLSPRVGPYSTDTWALLVIYLRNLFVNSLFIVPFAVAAVSLWRMLLHGYDVPLRIGFPASNEIEGWPTDWYAAGRLILTVVFLLAFGIGVLCLLVEEENLYDAGLEPARRSDHPEHFTSTHYGILFMFLILAVTGPWLFSIDPHIVGKNPAIEYAHANQLRFYGQSWLDAWAGNWPTWVRFSVAFLVPTLILSLAVRTWGWRRRALRLRGNKTLTWREALAAAGYNWGGLLTDLCLAFCFGAAFFGVLNLVWLLSFQAAHDGNSAPLCHLLVMGPPLTLAAMVFAGFVEMGLVGRLLNEYEREWRARLGACLLMGAAAWLVIGAATLYLPWLCEVLFAWVGNWVGSQQITPGALRTILTTLWAAISGGGAWAATRPAATDPTQPGAWWIRPLTTVAPAVFVLGLVAGVSGVGQIVIDYLGGNTHGGSFLQRVTQNPITTVCLIGLAVGMCLLFGLLIQVNRFSMHFLYANRLTRCYLGASRLKQGGSLGAATGVPPTAPLRPTNLFTGFDPLDDFPLADLRTVGGSTPYAGPIPLINCALNCLAGDELAYQDRREDAFLVTPEKCGGRLTGYADTPADDANANNLTLGRAMTISGAALDPNMNGLSPALTALMTLFNARLGWWMENPSPIYRPYRHKKAPWEASQPGFAGLLLNELIGSTNEKDAYVHLSDGGHFENLAVYELIRRRCRFIIVVDGGTDRTAASDNMAAMLRLARTDFGVNIELNADEMQLQKADGYSKWHCAVGRIRYDEVDEAARPGLLVYLQATMTGDEPPDLLQYVSRCPDFPRQSTLNQFFDEAQFEGYRALGQHIAVKVFGEAACQWSGQPQNADQHCDEAAKVFAAVREQWLPSLPVAEPARLEAAQAALWLERGLAANPSLNRFNREVYPELPREGLGQLWEIQEFQEVDQTLQVMEVAWAASRLEEFHAHPLNRGWMNTFRRWTSSQTLHRYWPFLRAEYSKPFVDFCEDVLNLLPAQVKVERVADIPADVREKLVADLDPQFGQEWSEAVRRLKLPAAFAGAEFIKGLVNDRWNKNPEKEPLLWRVLQAPADVNAKPYCCGTIVAAQSPRQRLLQPAAGLLADEAELFVWIRGPYRAIGLGAEAVRQVLQEIEMESAFADPKYALKRLTVYYPQVGPGPGGRLQVERWMNFFFDQGFRRVHQPDTGVGSKFVVLKRGLNGAPVVS